MSKFKSALVLGVLTSVTPLVALAQGGISPVPVAPETTSLLNIINAIINFAFGLLLVVAALFIIYAAYLYLSSGGSEDAIGKARNFILYALIAIVIAFLARVIPFIVRQVLGQA